MNCENKIEKEEVKEMMPRKEVEIEMMPRKEDIAPNYSRRSVGTQQEARHNFITELMKHAKQVITLVVLLIVIVITIYSVILNLFKGPQQDKSIDESLKILNDLNNLPIIGALGSQSFHNPQFNNSIHPHQLNTSTN